MRVNITSLEITLSQSGDHIAWRIEAPDLKWPISFIMTWQEAKLTLRWQRKGHATPFFSDYSLMSVNRYGVVYIDMGADKPERVYLTFPFWDEVFESFRKSVLADWQDIRFGPKDIEAWSKKYAPVVEWKFHQSYGAEDYQVENLWQTFCADNQHGWLQNWAESYSNGQLVTVNVSLDSRFDASQPPSFYFWLRDPSMPDVHILNGGIIWHASSNRYGTHT